MIEGVDGIIRKGATIADDIKVADITENKVKFESGTGSWEQKIGQAADVQWK